MYSAAQAHCMVVNGGLCFVFFSIQRLLLSTLALYSNQGSLGREGEGAGIKVSN